MVTWIMLVYRLPRSKTSAYKVAVWRKLKKLGAFSLQDSVCVLPYNERTLEDFEWLAAEIREKGGQASVWQTQTLTVSQQRELRDFFLDQVNVEYERIIRQSTRAQDRERLQSLWMQYHRVRAQDYLKSPLSREAGAACEKRAQELRDVEVRE